jgi:hypothetical protein
VDDHDDSGYNIKCSQRQVRWEIKYYTVSCMQTVVQCVCMVVVIGEVPVIICKIWA